MTLVEIRQVSRMKMRILLDGESAFILSPAQVHQWGLSDGKELDEVQEEELYRQARLLAARTAVDLLVRREYSASDLRQKLLRKEFREDLADFALEYVRQRHYQDDRRFAESYVRSHTGRCSQRQMQAGLARHGISQETIREAVAAFGPEDGESLLLELEKRFPYGKEIPQPKDPAYAKLIRSLLHKGYRYHDIQDAIRLFQENNTL